MARHDDRERIASGGRACRARATRRTRAPRELRVGDHLAVRNARDLAPDAPLEAGAIARQHELEPEAMAVQVFQQLPLAFGERRVPWIFRPARIDRGRMTAALE